MAGGLSRLPEQQPHTLRSGSDGCSAELRGKGNVGMEEAASEGLLAPSRSSYSPYPRENRLPDFLGTEKKKQIGGLPVTRALIEVMKGWGKLILKLRSRLSV